MQKTEKKKLKMKQNEKQRAHLVERAEIKQKKI